MYAHGGGSTYRRERRGIIDSCGLPDAALFILSAGTVFFGPSGIAAAEAGLDCDSVDALRQQLRARPRRAPAPALCRRAGAEPT
eukprot:gene3009-2844_t